MKYLDLGSYFSARNIVYTELRSEESSSVESGWSGSHINWDRIHCSLLLLLTLCTHMTRGRSGEEQG